MKNNLAHQIGHQNCKICGADTSELGVKQGCLRRESFNIRRCENCGYAFVENPWVEYEQIYSKEYYSGFGADPSVDYLFELECPDETIRCYEWRGILDTVKAAIALDKSTRWLDFGCGNGGLVRHCKDNLGCAIWGYEEGWIRDRAANGGIPLLSSSDLVEVRGSFDVVTAIEVLEHVPDPLQTLKEIRALLRPGGLFFFTTGNAEPQKSHLLHWPYLIPEIHISLFEPRTLARSLELAGFRPQFRGYCAGFENIIRFKILKNIGIKKVSAWERALPWWLLSRLADRRVGVTAHPIGWAV